MVGLNWSLQDDDSERTEGLLQLAHSENLDSAYLHLTSSPSGSNARSWMFLKQFDGTLKAGNMVVWGDLLAWFVSDLFLSSTKVTALHALTPFWF